MGEFDYESRIWGFKKIDLSPFNSGSLTLKYLLEDLGKINGKVLDVGCGSGAFTEAVERHRPDLEVYGCDVSRKAIVTAKKESGNILFSVCDAENLPFPDSSFDVVILKFVLEHVSEPKKVLQESYRVLKKGGIVHSITPLEGSKFTLHGFLGSLVTRSIRKYEGHLRHFNKRNLIKPHEKVGFKVLRQRFSGYFLYQLTDVLYYPLLDVLGAPVSFSVAGYVETEKPSVFTKPLSFLRKSLALAYYFESVLLKGFPGFFMHITARKL
jgi:ubiquinone/menaquinone biosynthesis C-methylase UbiE